MFSFNVEIWEQLLYSINSILPYIDKSIAIFYNNNEKTILAKSYSARKNNNLLVDLDVSNSINPLYELRSERLDKWLLNSEIPFELNNNEKKEYNLFSENERNILALSFLNQYDNKYDILYIYFSLSNSFELGSNSINYFSAENKKLISLLIKNFIKHIIKTNNSDKKNYNKLTELIKNLQQLIKAKEKANNIDWVEYAEHILRNEKTDNHPAHYYMLSEDAKAVISNYKGKIYHFADYIKKAAKNALFLNNLNNDDRIIIDTYNFALLEEMDNTDSNNFRIIENIETCHHKAYMLLDRYEEAAQRAINNKSSDAKIKYLTGSEIGKYVGDGISAAAISDAIRKQRMQISKLLTNKDLAGKWQLLKKYFRPITNTLTAKEILKNKLA